MDIREYLKKNRLIVDGSMGTYYSNLMNQAGVMSERGNLSSPQLIEQIHLDYIKAGARLIRTNTFAANQRTLRISREEQIHLIREACGHSKRAVKESKEPVWIMGNIGPIGEDAASDYDEVLDEYQRICQTFLDEDLDGIHFETFSNLRYIVELLPWLKERKPNLFIMVSFSLNKNGYTSSGIRANRLLERITQIPEIDCCGFNCGVGSGHMEQLLRKIMLPQDKYIYIAPNAGYPETMQNRMVFMDNERYFASNMKQIACHGIDLLGGCCGTTPDYIKAMAGAVGLEKESRTWKEQGSIPNDETKAKSNEFIERFQEEKKVIAVELDPPYDADIEKIMECAHSLKATGVDIITLADSPMGRSRVDSVLMSLKIAEETKMPVMPHICCRDKNMISMRAGLLGAYLHGIRNLLLVTGDPVPGENRMSITGVFDYNSIRLMEYVKEMNLEHFVKDPICYGGALNYGRGSIEAVIKRMKQKIDAGASYFLTQPVYSKEDVERLRAIRQAVDTKILVGIMPLVSFRNANFIKNEITGIHVPDEIVGRYDPEMSKEEAENVGVAIAMETMEMTADFADGYYFMLPFNRVSIMEKIKL